MHQRLLIAVAVTSAMLACSALAVTIHVPTDQPTIQAGINASSAGDTVQVACGTYFEHDIVLHSGICLLSETRDSDCATIDAQGIGRVLLIENVPEEGVIQGFTFTGGYGGDSLGAGVSCVSSSPSLANCLFLSNDASARSGGGLYCHSSDPHITECVFMNNEGGSRGGGIYIVSCLRPVLLDCWFLNNTASTGGSVVMAGSAPEFTDCVFVNSTARHSGGCLYITDGSHPILSNCTIYGSHAASFGGGMVVAYGAATRPTRFVNCIVAFTTFGGAVHCGAENPIPSFSCSDLYGNVGGDWVGCIAHQFGVNGNFSADPLFCNPSEGDFTLAGNSPCLPGNHPANWNCGLIGALGQGCGPVAVTPKTWARVKARYR